MADPGFPGGANPKGGTTPLFDHFFLKTAWKWRNFGASLALPPHPRSVNATGSSSCRFVQFGRAIRHFVALVHHGRDVRLHHLAVRVEFVQVQQNDARQHDWQQATCKCAKSDRVGRLGSEPNQLGPNAFSRWKFKAIWFFLLKFVLFSSRRRTVLQAEEKILCKKSNYNNCYLNRDRRCSWMCEKSDSPETRWLGISAFRFSRCVCQNNCH